MINTLFRQLSLGLLGSWPISSGSVVRPSWHPPQPRWSPRVCSCCSILGSPRGRSAAGRSRTASAAGDGRGVADGVAGIAQLLRMDQVRGSSFPQAARKGVGHVWNIYAAPLTPKPPPCRQIWQSHGTSHDWLRHFCRMNCGGGSSIGEATTDVKSASLLPCDWHICSTFIPLIPYSTTPIVNIPTQWSVWAW